MDEFGWYNNFGLFKDIIKSYQLFPVKRIRCHDKCSFHKCKKLTHNSPLLCRQVPLLVFHMFPVQCWRHRERERDEFTVAAAFWAPVSGWVLARCPMRDWSALLIHLTDTLRTRPPHANEGRRDQPALTQSEEACLETTHLQVKCFRRLNSFGLNVLFLAVKKTSTWHER